MSRRKADVSLSADAEHDIEEILLYTERTWGASQTRAYRNRLERGLQRLAEFPCSGQRRDNLAPDLRSGKVGYHLAFYLIQAEGIVVVRILHPRQDVEAEFR